jgi:hypothetical protein
LVTPLDLIIRKKKFPLSAINITTLNNILSNINFKKYIVGLRIYII